MNSSKLTFTDGEDLDMERIGKIILDIHREALKESRAKKVDKEIDSKEIHRAMTVLGVLFILLSRISKKPWSS